MMNFSSHKKKALEFKEIRESILSHDIKPESDFKRTHNYKLIRKFKRKPLSKRAFLVFLRIFQSCLSLHFSKPQWAFLAFVALFYQGQKTQAGDLRCLIGDDPQEKAECLRKGYWSASLQMPWVFAEKTTISHFYSRGSFVLDRVVKKRATISQWKSIDLNVEKSTSNIHILKAISGELSGECTGSVRIDVLAEHANFDDINVSLIPSGHLPCNHVSLQFADSHDEVFSGAGEQFTYLFLDGQQIDTLSQEQGHGKGKQPITWIGNKLGGGAGGREGNTYAGHPILVSSAGRGLFLNDPYQVRIDLKSKGLLKIQSLVEKPLRLTLMHHIEPRELTREYTKRFGRMRDLPDWAHRGMMLGIQGGRAKIEKAINNLVGHHSKLSSVWIQDWVGQRFGMFWQRLRWHWEVDRALYPDWEELIQDLGSRGLHTVSYLNARFSPNKECGLNCDFHTVISRGYGVKALSGLPYLIGSGGFDFIKLDLTNTKAREWFRERMENHADTGVQGWMTDFSESLPFDVSLFDVKSSGDNTPEEYHGNYIRDWAKLSRSVLDDKVGDGSFMMMRGGNQRALSYVNAYWTGDQLETWDRFDGMHSALIGMISGGLSGMGITHSDIGGVIAFPALNYRRTEELYLRWLQMSAFTAMMRTHEGSNPESTHQFDSTEHSLKQTAFYSRLFATLFDYRKNLLTDYQNTGVPLMRPMFMEHPSEKVTWSLDDQFYLGPDLIVAPVLKPGLRQRSVWLPKGVWTNLFSGCEERILASKFLEVSTPLDQIPVFIRKNSGVEKTLLSFLREESQISSPDRITPCVIR